MKNIGKNLCAVLLIMTTVELMLVYGLHPLLLNNGYYVWLFTLIILEASLYKVLMLLSVSMAVFYTMVLADFLFTRLMKRIGEKR